MSELFTDLSSLIAAATSPTKLPSFCAVAASYTPAALPIIDIQPPTIDVPTTTPADLQVNWLRYRHKKPAEVAGAFHATPAALPTVKLAGTAVPSLPNSTVATATSMQRLHSQT